MAPRQRQRRIVLTTQQAFSSDNEDLSPSPSETSSDCATAEQQEYSSNGNNMDNFCLRTKADMAKEDHDIFNLFALVFLITATLANWDFSDIIQRGGISQESWTDHYFFTSLFVTVGYFLIDLLWVAFIPISVKSPGTIIKHHFVVIAYLAGPVLWPEYRWIMGACLTVEINTWFLILRRVLFKRKANVHLQTAVEVGFYISWIAVRVILYPVIMYLFCVMALDRIHETGYYFHYPMLFMPVHAFLCVLNLKWTYDLFLPFFIKHPSPSQPASGL